MIGFPLGLAFCPFKWSFLRTLREEGVLGKVNYVFPQCWSVFRLYSICIAVEWTAVMRQGGLIRSFPQT